MNRCLTCNVIDMRQFCRFSTVYHDLILSNSITCRVQTTRCTMMQFCWSIPLSIDYVWNTSIDRLSRLLHAHIAYGIDTAKIISAYCRIAYCLHELICLNSIVCQFQTIWWTMMWFSMSNSDIKWLFLKCVYW